MSRHLLVGRFGLRDRVAIPAAADEQQTQIDLVVGDRRLAYGLGQALDDLLGLDVIPTEIGVDLGVLAVLVHAADTRLERASTADDGWTREVRLVVPVSDPALWADVTSLLERMLGFLTGDRWTVAFRSRLRAFARTTALRDPRPTPRFDTVSLFSGGADSLIGAVDLLEEGAIPLLVSHAGDGVTSAAQQECELGMHRAYLGHDFRRLRVWTVLPDGLVDAVKSEPTTRGRSFLFIALGALVASGVAAAGVTPVTVGVPENGFIALNVPLDPLRLGALSTKTTHPFFLSCWNSLLEGLGLAVRVHNRYAARTKGEMVAGCRNPLLARALLPQTLSCASPTKGRWQGRPPEHCGHCVPCVIRRAALESAWGRGNDPTPYTLADLAARPLDTRQAEGQQIRSFQLAAARLRAHPELARVLVHKPGPLSRSEVSVSELADTYARGLREVDTLLASAVTTPS